MMDIGSARLGMIVADRLRRKRKITSTTSTRVISSVKVTSCTDSWIVTDRSNSNCPFTDGGMSVCTRARAAFTLLATSTVKVQLLFDRSVTIQESVHDVTFTLEITL